MEIITALLGGILDSEAFLATREDQFMQNVVSPPVLIREHGGVCQYRNKKPCSTEISRLIEDYNGLGTRL